MKGFCPGVLRHISDVTACNTPSFKVTPAGFLQMLLSLPDSSALKKADNGHYIDVTLKYKKRLLPEQTTTEDSCNVNLMPQWHEATLPSSQYRQIVQFWDDETMAKYCEDATRTVMLGQPATASMQEVLDDIKNASNALIGAIDKDLLALMVMKFGVNVATGSANATTVNIPKDATQYDLNTGITKILADSQLNEICGSVKIVGSGLFNNFTLQQLVSCCNAAGIDQSRFSGFQFYHDLYAPGAWGNNQIGVFSDGSVGLIEYNRYQGWRAGDRGISKFFTLPIPVDCPECNGGYSGLVLDAQLKYFDCPQDLAIDCPDTTVPINRGWALILSKHFDLFTIPSDSYQSTAAPYNDCATDRLFGSNGTLRYTVTNS